MLKHRNAREHRDWRASLVRRALLTNTVYPRVEASPHRQPWPSRLSPKAALGRGAGRGRRWGLQGPLGGLWSGAFPQGAGQPGEPGVGCLLLVRDAAWRLCSTDAETGVCGLCPDLDKPCLFPPCCQKPYLKFLPLCATKSRWECYLCGYCQLLSRQHRSQEQDHPVQDLCGPWGADPRGWSPGPLPRVRDTGTLRSAGRAG